MKAFQAIQKQDSPVFRVLTSDFEQEDQEAFYESMDWTGSAYETSDALFSLPGGLRPDLNPCQSSNYSAHKIAQYSPHPLFLHPIQAKMMLGGPNDQYEQEADFMAAQVVRKIHSPMAQDIIQSKTLQSQNSETEEMRKPLSNQPRNEWAQHQSIDEIEAAAQLERTIKQKQRSGQPLSAQILEPMEQAFNADFSKVRVHTDRRSDELNQSIQAKAFTIGQDVFFRKKTYQPENQSGQELIAHELTHVLQQNTGIHKQRRLDSSKTIASPVKIQRRLVTDEEEINKYLCVSDSWKERVSVVQKMIKRQIKRLENEDLLLLTTELNNCSLDLEESYSNEQEATFKLAQINKIVGKYKPEVLHPGDLENAAPNEQTDQGKHLAEVVSFTAQMMRLISQGDARADEYIDKVFLSWGPISPLRKKVKNIFLQGSLALLRLYKNGEVKLDLRGDFYVKQVGALTDFKSMTLPRDFVSKKSTNKDVLKLIHEAMHAIGERQIIDIIYRGNPDFSTLPEKDKLINADHFAAVAAQWLEGGEESDIQVPIGATKTQTPTMLGTLHREVESFFTLAWVVSLWLLEHMEVLRKIQVKQYVEESKKTIF